MSVKFENKQYSCGDVSAIGAMSSIVARVRDGVELRPTAATIDVYLA